MKKAGMISLGCNKNRVDSEMMLKMLSDDGWEITPDASEADIIIVNTCGFIEDAKKESIEAIFDMAENKEQGRLKKLIVTGCFGQRYADDIMSDMPEVDGIIGVFQYGRFISLLDRIIKGERAAFTDSGEAVDISGERLLTTPRHTAYVRIADGCNNFCSFCAIPLIRGRYKSRPIESIVKEAQELCARGVKELVIVAQDTTRYGEDLYGQPRLTELLRTLLRETNAPWIRVLYCYPELVGEELINLVAFEDRLCSYLDVPVQHISDRILRAMNRRSSSDDIRRMADAAENAGRPIALRTSLIAGFPGETEKDHLELLDFVKEGHFMHMGAFAYSKEEGTAAAKLRMVPKRIRAERLDRLMTAQREVSRRRHAAFIGQEMDVLVEGSENGKAYGRTEYQAPETDGITYLDKDAPVGEFVRVRIVSAGDYDMNGEIL